MVGRRVTHTVSGTVFTRSAGRRPRARSARLARSSRSSCSRATTRTSGRRKSTRSTRPATAAHNPLISRRSCSPCALSRPWISTRPRRAEFDSRYRELRHDFSERARTPGARSCNPPSAGARERSSPSLDGFNNPDFLDHSLNVSSTVRTRNNKYGSVYSLNYDILRATLVQQRIDGVLQRAVLRRRIRVPESRLFRFFRPPFFHVLHARRPRQLLAVQRRPRRRAALMRPDDRRMLACGDLS